MENLCSAEITLEIKYAGDRDAIISETMGTYSLSDFNYLLIVDDVTTTIDGDDWIEQPDIGGFQFVSETTNAGTWIRKGNTLTLNGNDGETIAFKKQ